MNKKESVESTTASDEAACWLLRLEETTSSPDTFIEWQRWLNATPENRAAYEEIEETVLRLGRMSVIPDLPSAQEMAQDTYDGSQPIAEWKRSALQRSRWNRFAIAASVAAIALLGGVLRLPHARTSPVAAFSYKTPPGEQQIVHLPEGSTVTLDADSALEVQLTSTRRSLTLERGEAYFQVSKDPRRPFVVNVGTAHVTAIGTAFNVRLSDDRTVVAVTEGKVEFVAIPKQAASSSTESPGSHAVPTEAPLAARVGAGGAISYRDHGELQALPANEAPLATAWLDGRRQYRDEPLRYVLADVDRYTGRRIELANDATGDLRFTGTLNLKNSDAWLRGLSVALPVTIVARDDGALSIALREER